MQIFRRLVWFFVAWLFCGAALAQGAGDSWAAWDPSKAHQDDTARLEQIIREAPRHSSILFPGPHVYRITKDLSFRPDLALVFQNGAVLTPESNVTIEIKGVIHADLFPIFSGAGKIRLADTAAPEVFPQWWGAFSDGSHAGETTRAIQMALDTGMKVFFSNGVYLNQGVTVGVNGAIIAGANREKTVLKFVGTKGSALILKGSFVKVSDLALQGAAKDSSSTSTGIHFIDSSRSQIENVRVNDFGYGVQVTKLGGNNISHCYIFRNTRAGIYLPGAAHGLSITNGTEIADAPFGIVLGKFRDTPWDIDYDSTDVTGQMVSVQGAIIEGLHAVGNGKCSDCVGGIGIFSGMGQKGITVNDTYFEAMKSALQLGSQFMNDGKTPHSTGVLNIVFRDNFLSNVKSAVKVGRAKFGDISNNHCAGVPHFFDTSEAGLFSEVKVEHNFGYGKLVSKPFAGDFGKDVH